MRQVLTSDVFDLNAKRASFVRFAYFFDNLLCSLDAPILRDYLKRNFSRSTDELPYLYTFHLLTPFPRPPSRGLFLVLVPRRVRGAYPCRYALRENQNLLLLLGADSLQRLKQLAYILQFHFLHPFYTKHSYLVYILHKLLVKVNTFLLTKTNDLYNI